MADVYICVSVIILLQCFLCIGFILSNGNRTTLPQYAKYGKSMVLVGGNLEDNNTEIYDTIVQMAVSHFWFLFNPFKPNGISKLSN